MKNSFKIFALLMIFPTVAPAQDWSGFYGGLSYGNGRGPLAAVGTPGYDLDGNVLGVFAGYNMQAGNLVYGGELAYQTGDVYLVGSTNQGIDRLVDLKGRLGYAAGPALIYGVLGYSSNNYFYQSSDSPGGGAAYGVGVDYQLSERTFIGAEYLRRDMHNDEAIPITEIEPSVSTLSLRLGMKF